MANDLTEEDLRAAAAEAGISPEELRRALAGDTGDLPAKVRTPGDTGVSVYKAETSLQMPPEQALETVKRSIERLVGSRGHRQGAGRADIVDETRGVVYRLESRADGQGGALVRADIDPSSGSGGLALRGVAFGGLALAFFGLGVLLGSTAIIGLGIGIATLGVLTYVLSKRRLSLGTRDGQAIVAQALLEAEDAPAPSGPVALPPSGR